MTADLVAHWNELVAAAMLGTDRRDPPRPVGPLADLAVESGATGGSASLVQQVSALTVALRSGLTGRPAVPTPMPPDADQRPPTPPTSTATWQEIVDEWPVLEPEWLDLVVASGRRLSCELVAPLLERHRTAPAMHDRVLVAAGPIARWMIDWSSRLACTTRRSTSGAGTDVASVLVPELVPLLVADPPTVGTALETMARAGVLGAAHRGVVTNLVAHLPHATLPCAAAAFVAVADEGVLPGVWYPMARLADLRHRMIAELATELEHDR